MVRPIRSKLREPNFIGRVLNGVPVRIIEVNQIDGRDAASLKRQVIVNHRPLVLVGKRGQGTQRGGHLPQLFIQRLDQSCDPNIVADVASPIMST